MAASARGGRCPLRAGSASRMSQCADDVATDMTWIKTSCRLYRSLSSSTGPRSAHSAPLVLSPGFDRLGAQDLEVGLLKWTPATPPPARISGIDVNQHRSENPTHIAIQDPDVT